MTHPAGTIFVLCSNGWMADLIKLLTRSRVNHTGVALGDGRTVEAMPRGATIGREQDGPNVIWGTDLLAMIEAQRPGAGARIAAEALRLVGRPYGFLDIFALGLTAIGLRWGWLERIVGRQDRLICSQLVDLACLNAGVHLYDKPPRLPQNVTPGDIEWLVASDGQGVLVDRTAPSQ